MDTQTTAELMQHDLFGAAPTPHRRQRREDDLAQRLRELSKPDMVRVSPDRHAWVPRATIKDPPKFCLCRWSRNSDGHYAPTPVSGRMVRLDGDLVEKLGFHDKRRRRRWETIMRLGRAGYIDLLHLSPGCWMLDLDSWYRHLADCADNPEMWEEGGDERENYLHVNGLGGWKKTEAKTHKPQTRKTSCKR
jgi:hypothetical protein